MPITDSPDGAAAHNLRAEVVQAVKTPLGFFALVVLVIEAILGTVAVAGAGGDRTLTIIGMLVVIIGLIVVVAYFAYHRPEALFGLRHKEEIDAGSLTATLQNKVEHVTEENQQLRAEILKLTSLRYKILALLGADSADPQTILRKLDLANDPNGRNEAMSVIGKLVEDGTIEPDGMKPAGYYRLRRSR